MLRILAVDGDARELEHLRKCMEELSPNFELVTFIDPMLAVKYMVNNRGGIDAVFTALLMKHMNGIDFIKYTHNAAPGALVFVTTQTDTWEIRELARRGGANGCLLKPLTAESIRLAMEEFLYELPLQA